MAKKIVVVRSSEDDRHHHKRLSSDGRVKVRKLAEKLAPHVDGSSAAVFSSAVIRASESAAVIADTLKIGFMATHLLLPKHLRDGGGISSGEAFLEVWKLIDGPDVVILVVHCEFTEEFPPFVGKQLNVAMYGQVIPEGTACIIDCVEKTMVHVK